VNHEHVVLVRVVVKGARNQQQAEQYVRDAVDVGADGPGRETVVKVDALPTRETVRKLRTAQQALREGLRNCGDDPDSLWHEPHGELSLVLDAVQKGL
jgi:hypothetical protein